MSTVPSRDQTLRDLHCDQTHDILLPDASFSGSGKRKNESKGITQIMTMIIEDLDDEIKNGMKSEEEAQLEYEGLMKAATELKEELIKKKIALSNAITQRTQERTDEKADMDANNVDLKDEEDYKAEITPDCDWIIGAFTKRAEARAAEMEGLTTAKSFLAGQGGAASMLQGKVFDDAALGAIRFQKLRR